MSCGKRWTFQTRKEAEKAMRGIPPNAAGLIPIRVYKCHSCKGWHMTTNPRSKHYAQKR